MTRIPHLALSLIGALALTAGAAAQESVTAELSGTDGTGHGTVTLQQTPSGVLIAAEFTGLPAGEHGFHIHETGACDAADGFKSAGGHFAGTSETHGFSAEGGPHSGDMPNIHAPDGGTLTVEIHNPRVSLAEGEPGYLLDEDGSAIVVHSGPDDYESQPSGEAGERIACGVIGAQ